MRFIFLAVLAVLATGCPNWNRPSCAPVGRYSCVRNQPHYCSTGSGELTPVGDEPCSGRTPVCRIDPDGIGACAAALDGGGQ